MAPYTKPKEYSGWVLDMRPKAEGQVRIAVTDCQQYLVSRPLKKGAQCISSNLVKPHRTGVTVIFCDVICCHLVLCLRKSRVTG